MTIHGFLRSPDGKMTTFDAPGAGTGPNQGTYAYNINLAGEIAGQYADAGGVDHGFVRAPDGTITAFNCPGAGTGSGQGTFTATTDGLNLWGAIAGAYLDASNMYHGCLRAPDGTFTTFDVKGAGTGSFQGTNAGGINPAGMIQGGYYDASGVEHGFVRAPDGAITKFDVAASQGTNAANINLAGEITGEYLDASGVDHGYVRAPDGAITKFDAPGAGTGSGQGTEPISNNWTGAVTGFYIDDSNVLHGFFADRQLAMKQPKSGGRGAARLSLSEAKGQTGVPLWEGLTNLYKKSCNAFWPNCVYSCGPVVAVNRVPDCHSPRQHRLLLTPVPAVRAPRWAVGPEQASAPAAPRP